MYISNNRCCTEGRGSRMTFYCWKFLALNIGRPYQGADAICINPTSMCHKIESKRSCPAKFDEGFAMLIPKVPIHSSIRPLPQAIVPATRCGFRLCENVGVQFDSFPPGANVKFVEPNALAIGWRYVRKRPIMQTTKADHVLMLALSTNRFTRTFH